MSVVNGLGATITALVYRDGDTVVSLAGAVAARRQGDVCRRGGTGRGERRARRPAAVVAIRCTSFEHQPAGSYLAVLERSPFWDPGVPGVAERGSFHLVLGWPGGQP